MLSSALIGMEGDVPVDSMDPTATDETPVPKKKSKNLGFKCDDKGEGKCQGTIAEEHKGSFGRFTAEVNAHRANINENTPAYLNARLGGDNALDHFVAECKYIYQKKDAMISISKSAKKENTDRGTARSTAEVLCHKFGQFAKIAETCKASKCGLKEMFYTGDETSPSAVMILRTKDTYKVLTLSWDLENFTFQTKDIDFQKLFDDYISPRIHENHFYEGRGPFVYTKELNNLEPQDSASTASSEDGTAPAVIPGKKKKKGSAE